MIYTQTLMSFKVKKIFWLQRPDSQLLLLGHQSSQGWASRDVDANPEGDVLQIVPKQAEVCFSNVFLLISGHN